MRKTKALLSAISLLCITSLTGCATTDFVTGMTPEQIKANPELYIELMARAYNQPYTPTQLNMPTPPVIQQAPTITPYGQPNTYSTWWCKDVAGNVIACNQIR